MYLKKLSANNEQFHTVEFKEGLNFIIGRRENPNIKELKETYNGVGKSLIIELIHFCLGSKKVDAFEESLKDWTFALEFNIGSEEFVVKRSCENQNIISVNNQDITLAKYRELLGEKVFGINPTNKINNMTFRTLITRFIRRGKASYNKYDIYESKEIPYAKLINNGYLLGLDANLIEEKMKQKKEIDELIKTKKTVEKDEVLKEYFVGNEDLDINITDLRDNIKDLEVKLSDFQVAENYREIQKEADILSYKKKELTNKAILIDNSLRHIKKSLETKADIELDVILRMYDEAKMIFDNKIVRNLEQVTEFHNKLLESRKKRLQEQKEKFIREKNDVEKNIKECGDKLDKLIKFLGNHGALEEYVALTDKLNDLRLRLEKANDYKKLMETYEEKLSNANISNEQQKLITTKYIKDSKENLDNIM
ncbi:MAG: hypothetical protein ACRC7R_11155, partial [Sarcina sp.]